MPDQLPVTFQSIPDTILQCIGSAAVNLLDLDTVHDAVLGVYAGTGKTACIIEYRSGKRVAVDVRPIQPS